MEPLSHHDILALNRAIGEIYSARDLESFYQATFSAIHGMIPYDLCSYNDVSLHPVVRFLGIVTSSQEHGRVVNTRLPALNAHLQEHPLFSNFLSGAVVKTTDYASRNQFKATGVYNEYYRHLDTETQICFSLPVSSENAATFGLSRKTTDFSERDRLILTLLKPHLMGSLRNVRELGSLRLEKDLLEKGAEAERLGVVLCQPGGMIECISAFAKEMLHKYFSAPVGDGNNLPEPLLGWFKTEALSPANKGGAGGFPLRVEREELSVAKHDRCLRIKLLNDCTTGDYILFLTEADPSSPLQKMQGYGLTNRESEVLLWLSKGKTNAEIATILGMSRRTVEKHLEHIFPKLGVETRGAAAAILRHA